MNLKQIFIYNLKNIRKNSGISQMQLAILCNTATSYIGEIEIGRRFPSIDMIEKIADALQIHPQLLFADQQNHYKKGKPQIRPILPEIIKKDIVQSVAETTRRLLQKY
ncbi:MAG: helix-turn-helix domain-containing protein [Candidatus Margulisbacteria bacterium]|jgi:transcriptional regulator with XRE-family HTH domain|nr:helix-turn-helix domain-containing protein [Candidatus Margulisiibacteriota bacterium]